MKVDDTLLSIYNEVLDEIQHEKQIELSIEEIHAVFTSQLEAFKYGVIKNEPVHWLLIGKFLPLNRVATAKEARLFKEKLNELEKENSNLDTKSITAYYAAKKAIEKQDLVKSLKKDKPISLKKLLDKPDKTKYNKCKFTLKPKIK